MKCSFNAREMHVEFPACANPFGKPRKEISLPNNSAMYHEDGMPIAKVEPRKAVSTHMRNQNN